LRSSTAVRGPSGKWARASASSMSRSAPQGVVAGTGLLGGQQGLQLGRRLFRRRLERPGAIALLAAELADGVDQGAGQDGAEPGPHLLVAVASELVESLMGPQQRLLDDVRRIQLRLQPGIELQSRQQPQVLPVVLQREGGVTDAASHAALPTHRGARRAKDSRGRGPFSGPHGRRGRRTRGGDLMASILLARSCTGILQSTPGPAPRTSLRVPPPIWRSHGSDPAAGRHVARRAACPVAMISRRNPTKRRFRAKSSVVRAVVRVADGLPYGSAWSDDRGTPHRKTSGPPLDAPGSVRYSL
jgi:hypothetical protein